MLNDANAAALGEICVGGGRGKQNAVFVTLGTGVGGGILVGGKLLTGVHGSGGEIGHIKVTMTQPAAAAAARSDAWSNMPRPPASSRPHGNCLRGKWAAA